MASTAVIIDADPGIDDVVALALALRSPELDVRAISTVYGNATLAATTRNAQEVMRLLGRADVTIHPGSERPLRRPLVTARETHGATGVGYAPVPAESPVASDPAVLVTLLRRVDRPVTLITLGPLTNLAHALAADRREVHRKVARHLGMFGNLYERGNTNRWADFNAWCDPEATATVLQSGLPTMMVGLDVTRRMELSASEVERVAGDADPLVSWLGAALRFYVEFHRAQERLDGCVVNDVLPICELLHPGVLATRDVPLIVDRDEGEHRGHTREQSAGALSRVALQVDIRAVRALLRRVFGSAIGSGEPEAVRPAD